ncbi:MAG: hypothetical protein H0X64_09825, partial [Gemmatimonadaceae bacterium]|nr:hypothetical protein [Gemmatimonadaceae bacterium]
MSVVRIARAVLLALATLTTACADSTGPGDTGAHGSLRFTYSGAVSGNFVAEGVIDVSSDAGPPTNAGAVALSEGDLFAVMGVRPKAGNRVDMFILSLGNMRGTGTANINLLTCQDVGSGACPSGVFMLDLDPEGAAIDPEPAVPGTPMYILTTGIITVTSRSATRIRGTFSGTAISADIASLG